MTQDRRRLSLKDKLDIMVRQSRCPLCGERLGALEGLEWDHEHALALGGADTNDNIRAVHIACHRVKTNGLPATTAGSDKGRIAKTRRLTNDVEEFRRRLLAKTPGTPREKSGKIKSRGFAKRRKA